MRYRKTKLMAWAVLIALLIGSGLAAQSGPEVTGEEIYGFAKAQADFGSRRPGTEAYEKAGAHIQGLTEQWGCEVETDSIPTEQYFANSWSLKMVTPEGRALECFPMRHAGDTPAEGLTAEVVYVGRGTESDYRGKDVKGKIVLVKWGHRVFNLISLGALRDSYQLAVDKGAVGYLQFFTNTPGNSYQLMTAYVDDPARAIPGFAIGKEDARDLIKLMRHGDVRIKMALDGEEREVTATNIFALLPGMTDDVILIDTHYCSMFVGAVDNASGTAAALALAKYFSMKPKAERQKTLVFTFYGTHEYVDYKVGAQKFLADHPEMAAKVVAAIGLDHMAAYPDKEFFGRNSRIHLMTPLPGMDQLRGVFVSGDSATRQIVISSMFKHKLMPFVVIPPWLLEAIKFGESDGDSLLDWVICESGPSYRLGVPTVRIMMAPQWYHTRLDTVDHFSPDQLKRAVDAHIDIIEALDKAD